MDEKLEVKNGCGDADKYHAGQAAKKKCKERELLKLAYWKINRPK
jgi:hypothetical protein